MLNAGVLFTVADDPAEVLQIEVADVWPGGIVVVVEGPADTETVVEVTEVVVVLAATLLIGAILMGTPAEEYTKVTALETTD
jgi:hypothetical protein